LLTGVGAICAVTIAACGSGSTHPSGSSIAVAAAQLAGADHASFEKATLVADFTTLGPACQETTATLAAEISDGEQDLQRHGIKADAMTVANALVTAVDVLPASKTPALCNELIASYLNARGG
jgi:hypothetical protein